MFADLRSPVNAHRGGLTCMLLFAMLAIAGDATARYTEIVAFGDSATDMGNRGIATNSNSSIYPYQTWVKQLAGPTMLNISPFRPSGTSSWLGPGATNFAHGGATTKYVADLGLGDARGRNLTNQITERYLNPTWNSGGVLPDALHCLLIGMNDLNYLGQGNPGEVMASENFLNQHAVQVVRSAEIEIQALASAGVRKVLWLNLPDLSRIPAVFTSTGGNPTLLSRFAAASRVFNEEMEAAILRVETANPTVDVIPFDLHAWFNKILDAPSAYGFTNVTAGANNDNYLFTADRLHPTSHGHAVWAEAVYGAIAIPEPHSGFLGCLSAAIWMCAARRCRPRTADSHGAHVAVNRPELSMLRYASSWLAFTQLTTSVTVLGIALSMASAKVYAETALPETKPESERQLRGLTYTERSTSPLKLDLYLPRKNTPQPSPLIIWIHGGGFAMGGRDFCPLKSLADKGYAVASISYRLSGEAPFPAQIEDCKSAVRWLRGHAQEYNLAPERIGVCGESAGGLLASLLGTAPEIAAWGDDSTGVSSRVQAVVGLCPPTDLDVQEEQMAEYAARVSRLSGSKDSTDVAKSVAMQASVKLLTAVLGGPLEERRELARQMSPVTHVTSDDPPFLLIHGDRDDLVPLEHSQSLKSALDKAGVAAELVVVKGAGHGFGRPNGELMEKINAFFDLQLCH